jgi:hypothetical protein
MYEPGRAPSLDKGGSVTTEKSVFTYEYFFFEIDKRPLSEWRRKLWADPFGLSPTAPSRDIFRLQISSNSNANSDDDFRKIDLERRHILEFPIVFFVQRRNSLEQITEIGIFVSPQAVTLVHATTEGGMYKPEYLMKDMYTQSQKPLSISDGFDKNSQTD